MSAPPRRGWHLLLPLFVLLALAAIGPWLAPHDPLATDVANGLQAPSWRHWFGTDLLGRDIFSRVLTATRLDVGMALAAVLLSALLGNPIGMLLGYAGGRLDRWAGRLVEVLMAFPLFVVAMALVAVFGNSVGSLVLATAIINLPFYVRLARAEVLVRREAAYVQAARLGGLCGAAMLRRVLLPNLLPALAVQMSLNMGWAMLNAAGLSFIGLGVRPPTAEWGVMVGEGASVMLSGQWWVALFPGLALFAAIHVFTLTGDRLRDWLDPRQQP